MIDDQLLLGAPQPELDARLSELRALGVDRVRVSAFWSSHAPAGSAKPAGFDAARIPPIRTTTGARSTAWSRPRVPTASR